MLKLAQEEKKKGLKELLAEQKARETKRRELESAIKSKKESEKAVKIAEEKLVKENQRPVQRNVTTYITQATKSRDDDYKNAERLEALKQNQRELELRNRRKRVQKVDESDNRPKFEIDHKKTLKENIRLYKHNTKVISCLSYILPIMLGLVFLPIIWYTGFNYVGLLYVILLISTIITMRYKGLIDQYVRGHVDLYEDEVNYLKEQRSKRAYKQESAYVYGRHLDYQLGMINYIGTHLMQNFIVVSIVYVISYYGCINLILTNIVGG